ncbi:MAG: hypothetical protein ABFD12_14295 [Syntrophorhabdus sp.]
MQIKKEQLNKILKGIRIAKAVSTLAVVVVPTVVTVGVIAGYGAYALVKKATRKKCR